MSNETRNGPPGYRDPGDPNAEIIEGQIKRITADGRKPVPLPDKLTFDTKIKALKNQSHGSCGLYSAKWGIFYDYKVEPPGRFSDAKIFWRSQKVSSLEIITNPYGKIIGLDSRMT